MIVGELNSERQRGTSEEGIQVKSGVGGGAEDPQGTAVIGKKH